MNKFEQVSSDHHQPDVTIRGVPRSDVTPSCGRWGDHRSDVQGVGARSDVGDTLPDLFWGGDTLPCDISHDELDVANSSP